MIQKWLLPLGVLAVLAVMATPDQSYGQWVYRGGRAYHYPYNYGMFYGHYPYYYNYLFPPPETTVRYQPRYQTVYVPGLGYTLRYEQTGSTDSVYNSYQGFIPPPPPPVDTQAANTVVLEVRVPAPDAEVWIDGHKTAQTGTSRQFISPPLNPSQTYQYEVKAQWLAGGKTVEQTQKVVVQAGQRVGIDFLAGTAR
jgi:uncharacterized protein (TIGR03000 family)